jgi:hypothetical protein
MNEKNDTPEKGCREPGSLLEEAKGLTARS